MTGFLCPFHFAATARAKVLLRRGCTEVLLRCRLTPAAGGGRGDLGRNTLLILLNDPRLDSFVNTSPIKG